MSEVTRIEHAIEAAEPEELDLHALLRGCADAYAALLARAYIAQVFFLSGLTKLRDWDTTLLLFTEEYKVPLLSPGVAAVMGCGPL